jgi:hypothetical protein
MDGKERDSYINHLTCRASGAGTITSPAPTEATCKAIAADTVKRPCGTGTIGALEEVETKTDQR